MDTVLHGEESYQKHFTICCGIFWYISVTYFLLPIIQNIWELLTESHIEQFFLFINPPTYKHSFSNPRACNFTFIRSCGKQSNAFDRSVSNAAYSSPRNAFDRSVSNAAYSSPRSSDF